MRTVGHGTLSADALATLLVDAGVAHLVDVRSYPGSRRHPQHGREAMSRWLPDHGVAYTWVPALGGRRAVRPDSPHVALRHRGFRGYADHMESAEFGAGVDDLLAINDGEGVAVMCAETLWWHCHRRLLADALVLLRDVPVTHLGHDGKETPHRPTDGVRVDGSRLVYDVGATPPLDPTPAPGGP